MALWTFKDQIQALRDFLENKTGASELRRCKRAIFESLRELSNAHRWSYYQGLWQVSLVASQDSSTITYDHTGGAYERMVTLASGTWPSWAALGYLVIDSVPYKVAERKSSTVITLSTHTNPGADVAAGTAYMLYQDAYKLPETLLKIRSVISFGQQAWLDEIDPGAQAVYQRTLITPGQPHSYTIQGDPNYQGRSAIRVSPPPSAADVLELSYSRAPRQPWLDEATDGTVSNSAEGTTVTGSGTAFDSTMVGACLRISSSSTELPSGPDGDNPAVVERVIVSVASATSLTVDSAISSAYSGKKYLISDIIDIEQATMQNAFQRCCEAQLMLNSSNRDMYNNLYVEALIRGMEADNRVIEPRLVGGSRTAPRVRGQPYEGP